jgi:hypothetical protein
MRGWRKITVLGAALCLAAATLPLSAHHLISATYDDSRRVTITGTVIDMDWRNPHVWIHLGVTLADGRMVEWNLEAWGASQMKSRGFNDEFLKTNDVVRAEIFLSKDGSSRGVVRTLTLPNGRVLDGPPELFTRR